MRKWQREELLPIGTKVKFDSPGGKEYLLWRKIDPEITFTVLENTYLGYNRTFDVLLVSDDGDVLNVSNASTLSEEATVIT